MIKRNSTTTWSTLSSTNGWATRHNRAWTNKIVVAVSMPLPRTSTRPCHGSGTIWPDIRLTDAGAHQLLRDLSLAKAQRPRRVNSDKSDPTALVLFKCCHRCDLEQQFTLTGGSFKETAFVFIKWFSSPIKKSYDQMFPLRTVSDDYVCRRTL